MISDIIKNTIMIGCGSFVGGAARYLISVAMKSMSRGFPWATLLVNLAGCLIIGLLLGLFSKTSNEGSSWQLFLTVGFCGGFTTFSTFANESFQMLQNGNIAGFIAYVTTSIFVGIALIALSFWLVKIL